MINQTLFIAFFIVAAGGFAWSCRNRFAMAALGAGDNRLDNIPGRLQSALTYAVGQKRVISGSRFGINHAVLFWAFLILLLLNLEFVVSGLLPAVSFRQLPDALFYPLKGVFDLISLLVLIAVTAAALRKIINPLYPESRSFEAFFILGLIGALMVACFGMNGAEIVMGRYAATPLLPISSLAASLMTGLSAETAETIFRIFWWIHAALLLGFLNFLPYSKHMHILTAIPNTFFRSLEKPLLPAREKFKTGETFGVGRVDHFTWKDIFDTYTCTECGRCQDVCPSVNTDKPLNPRLMIHQIKENLIQNHLQLRKGADPATGLIDRDGCGHVPVDAIWSCVTCGACMEVCPVFIEHVPKIIKMRRHLVETEADFPDELLSLFENLEQRSNPWGIAPAERDKWSRHSDIRPFDRDKTEYLLFAGCAGSFDSRNKQVTLALSMILERAGVSWGILGKEELCCGDSARRLGNEYLFEQMALKNVELFRERGIKKVITQCPHCYTTLKNDYRQFGIELEVVHHSQLIDSLLQENRIPGIHPPAAGSRTTLHDSCYLGRHNGEYNAPRKIIQRVTGQEASEMACSRDRSFCCGAGGGRMWLEENLGTRMNRTRVQQAADTGADLVGVSCPYCLTMFEDGVKEIEAENLRVRDIAEIVAEAAFKPA